MEMSFYKIRILVLIAILSYIPTLRAQEKTFKKPYEIMERPYSFNKKSMSMGKLTRKEKLDSIVEKEIKYPTSLFQNKYKRTFTYDSAGNNKAFRSFSWIDSTELWLYQYELLKTFDKNNNLIFSEQFIWDSNEDELKPLYFYEYKYNSKNQKISYLYKYADIYTDYKYLKYGNGSYDYNELGSLICEYDTTIDPIIVNLPTDLKKTEYTYNNSQKELTKINASYDVSLKKYNFLFKKENIYDNNGNILKTTNFLRGNGDVFTWEPTNYYENTFNAKNQKIQSIYWKYNQDKRKILQDTKTEFFYDQNGNTMTELVYYFDNNKWFLGTKNNYTYNNNFELNDLIDVYDNNYPVFHNNMLTEINTEFWADTIWKPYQKKLFYYSTTMINVGVTEEIEANYTKIYPNPITDYLKIETKADLVSLTIFDIIGKQIGTFNLSDYNDKITLDLSTYTNGYYFIQIKQTNGEIITKQILKNSN